MKVQNFLITSMISIVGLGALSGCNNSHRNPLGAANKVRKSTTLKSDAVLMLKNYGFAEGVAEQKLSLLPLGARIVMGKDLKVLKPTVTLIPEPQAIKNGVPHYEVDPVVITSGTFQQDGVNLEAENESEVINPDLSAEWTPFPTPENGLKYENNLSLFISKDHIFEIQKLEFDEKASTITLSLSKTPIGSTNCGPVENEVQTNILKINISNPNALTKHSLSEFTVGDLKSILGTQMIILIPKTN